MKNEPNGSELDTYAMLTMMAQQNNNPMGSNAGAAGNLPPGFMDTFTGMGAGDMGGFQPGALSTLFGGAPGGGAPGMAGDLDVFSQMAVGFDNGDLQAGFFGQMLPNPFGNPAGHPGPGLFGAGALDFGGQPGPELFGPAQGMGPAFDPMGMHHPLGLDPMMPGPGAGGYYGDQTHGFPHGGMDGPQFAPQAGYGPAYDFPQQSFGQPGPGFGAYPGFGQPGQGFDPQYTSNNFGGMPGGYPPADGYPAYPQQPGYAHGQGY